MKYLNLILILAVIGAGAYFVFGGIARQAAQGYAEGGGSVEARLLSPETHNEAHAGDNGVAIAIQGDENSVNVAYDMTPQQQPQEIGNGRLVVLMAFIGCAACVVLFCFWLLTANHQGAYK